MKHPVYAVRDVHTGFMNLTMDQNDATATRNFAHAVKQTSSLMNSHPKDYSLYRVGQFDFETGDLTPCMPELVIDAYSLIE